MSNNFLPERSWAWPEELRQRGVLGINARNLRFISEQNARDRYPSVDNKLNTKQICHAHGIPVPETYVVLSEHSDVRRFHDRAHALGEFVVKPASGSAGRGIIIVSGVENGDYVLVERTDNVNTGDRVVAVIDDVSLMKRLRYTKGATVLEPESHDPRYKRIIMPDESHIFGKVHTVIPMGSEDEIVYEPIIN